MRAPFVSCGFLLLGVLCSAAEFDPYAGPHPVAVYLEVNPWADVIGADIPRVAVYENGEIIFLKVSGDERVYHHVVLDRPSFAKLTELWRPLLATTEFRANYNLAPNISDQMTARFFLRNGQREVATSVYGLSAKGGISVPNARTRGRERASAPPDGLLKLHTAMCQVDFPRSEEWNPKYVEVMLWDYSYAPGESIHWPSDWPGLDSERAKKRGDSWSLYLDGGMLPKLKAFLETSRPKGAIEIAGKKMASSCRFVFPSEPTWRMAFEKTAKGGRRAK
jgi:hypothetical protein